MRNQRRSIAGPVLFADMESEQAKKLDPSLNLSAIAAKWSWPESIPES